MADIKTESGHTHANRGPTAAMANHQAILRAARTVFAQRGYHVPFSAIAEEAGVGQAVLYRHFPDRLTLALALFEDNFAEFGQLAADPSPDAFTRLWRAIAHHVIHDAAFTETVVDARRMIPDYDGITRLHELLAPLLGRAQRAGLIDQDVTVAEVDLSVRMLYGIVATATETPEQLESIAATVFPRLSPDKASLHKPVMAE